VRDRRWSERKDGALPRRMCLADFHEDRVDLQRGEDVID
jgi:hypothetical protein